MKRWLREAGAGRLLYHLVHRPRGAAIESIRAGGPLEQWRTARGRRAMERAAAVLAPLPSPPAGAPEIHLMTGRKLWYQSAFFLVSLARHQPVRPVIHDDGTLPRGGRAELERLAPFARFIAPEQDEERVERLLPRGRFPALWSRRSQLILFRKLLDVHADSRGWRIFCDSDMLFFRRPEALIGWLREPAGALYLRDAERSYGCDLSLLEELAGGPVPDRVNTGILGLPGERIDWERMERWCRALLDRVGTHYYQEQAMAALLLSGLPHASLPAEDYVVLPSPREAVECRAVLHHYVAGSKKEYFRRNWRRFAQAPAA